ncbi:MAG: hypothetical protein ACTSRS_13930 [Candidatus Helarchaeota archaeon]
MSSNISKILELLKKLDAKELDLLMKNIFLDSTFREGLAKILVDVLNRVKMDPQPSP